jgi:hypothetical protein
MSTFSHATASFAAYCNTLRMPPSLLQLSSLLKTIQPANQLCFHVKQCVAHEPPTEWH